jgi:hypothetical protein
MSNAVRRGHLRASAASGTEGMSRTESDKPPECGARWSASAATIFIADTIEIHIDNAFSYH